MNHVVMCIYDLKLKAFSRPFFVQTVPAGVRSFTDEVNRPADDNPLYRHPEDFTLWHLADYDDLLGTFVGVMESVVSASSVKQER